MSSETTPDRRAHLVDEARSWIGTPWAHQQRQKGVGVDCAGLLTESGRACGLTTVDVRDYDRQPNGTLLGIMRRELVQIPICRIRPGSIVAIAYDGEPMHVGIVAPYRTHPDHLSIIHADNRRGKVVEHRMDDSIKRLIVAAFDYPGVDD